MRRLGLTTALLLSSCEEPRQAEVRQRVETAVDSAGLGRAEMSAGNPGRAVPHFKDAISATPGDVNLYLALAEAYRASGNEAGATLTLKQAEAVGGQDPAIRRQRAELLLKMHQTKAALAELSALRDDELLTDAELLSLATRLARAGRTDEAIQTLERVQRRIPDDPEAKVVESEILLLRGDTVLAARLMDRLLAEQPGLTSARLARARYFFNERRLDLAAQDLALIDARAARAREVVSLRARVLNEQGRSGEAAALLEAGLAQAPDDAELLALLAETRLLEGKGGEAQVLVDKVLAAEPSWPRALYVRGRAYEMQERWDEARLEFEGALRADPHFPPALSRLWRLQERRGDKAEAIATLEALFFLNELALDEKAALARYYVQTWANVERGQRLIGEALKREPKNPEYLRIKASLGTGTPRKKRAIEIIKGR